jgi:luciferase-like monooxygenase
LKWLAKIPGAPQVFDAMLLASTAVFRPARLRAMSAIEAAVSESPGMRVRVHRLGGIGFFNHGKESSHIHGNGLLDCHVGREKRDALIAEGRAVPHHLFPRSGWVSFWIEDEKHIIPALELIRIASDFRSTA